MSDVDHLIKLSKRIAMWSSDLRAGMDTSMTTIAHIQGIEDEVKQLEDRFSKAQRLIDRYCREECEYYETCVPLGNNCPLMIFREQYNKFPSALNSEASDLEGKS
jgi:hypothetical protein